MIRNTHTSLNLLLASKRISTVENQEAAWGFYGLQWKQIAQDSSDFASTAG